MSSGRGDAVHPSDDPPTLRAELEEARRQIARLEQSLVETQRLATVGELASRMAHEFNNILMMIMGRASNALKSDKAAAKDEALQKAVSCSQRGAEIVRGLLGYARGRQAQGHSIAADALMEAAVGLLAWDLKKVGIELIRQYDAAPAVHVVPGRIEQVLLNLMLNAVDAMNKGKPDLRKLVIKTENEKDGGVKVSVKDFGAGIDETHREKLFEPFYTTKPGGMGMGLAISERIIHAHGGSIWAENNPDPGATFYFTLPTADK